jgi:hypothetical protein
MSEPSAVVASATIARVLKDGTIRLQCDVPPQYRDVVASWLEPDLPVAIARLAKGAAATEMQQSVTSDKGAYGAQARELKLSGFFRSPDVWGVVGSDADYQIWCRNQACARCQTMGNESNPIIYAHVRRIADGAGTAIKPKYSGIPLHDSEHKEQHQRGEAAFGGKEWFDKERIDHVQAWAWETVKRQLGAESFRDVAPRRLLEWAIARGVERYLPACYQSEG